MDIVALDHNGRPIHIYHHVEPWSYLRLPTGVSAVLELSAGECERLGIAVGTEPLSFVTVAWHELNTERGCCEDGCHE